ncbi:acyl-CoA dehydrogenase family protein [Arthrobacter ginkgonis]|uniref:Acyl-CoA dehydrogenase family protein n=1 Tax=Arthrobacter ginkgonis TaxID=1630594 RepID=A0ABP7C6J3_9MICC
MLQTLETTTGLAAYVRDHAAEADAAGQLPAEMAAKMRQAGVIRMLQPVDFGGAEEHPLEFFDTVLEIGAAYPSAGWVTGVVGVHPFEIAQADRRVQEEIWGQDPDTWVASPYAPMGRAHRVDGGYLLSGRWPFSSGTDNCEWVVIGGILEPEPGQDGPGERRHFILQRDQYVIDQESWNVIGLKGTGSKDLVVQDAFVPDYRIVDPARISSGEAAREAGRDIPLYRMHWYMMFSAAITAGTLAIAQGALSVFEETVCSASREATAKALRDPHLMSELGNVSAELERSRTQFRHDITEMYAQAQANVPVTDAQRLTVRRNQVGLALRAVASVEKLFLLGGGHTIRETGAFQRYWRDIHCAGSHSANFAQPVFSAYGAFRMNGEIPAGVRF